MPYGSFHVSPRKTVKQALRLIKEAGVQAVKIEGGSKRIPTIEALLDAEIPVMGHLGLTPQSVNKLGGYKVQGRGSDASERLKEEARSLAEAGCFAIVLECIPGPLAAEISADLPIPTIGIGAGDGCDGQVLVFHDMLGLFEGLKPKFVKQYADLGAQAVQAVAQYVDEVRGGVFPGPEHAYSTEPRRKKTNGGVQQPAAGAPAPEGGNLAGTGYLEDVGEGKD